MRVRKRTFSKLIGKTSSYRILTMHCFLKKKKSLEAVKIESKASVATIDKKKTTSVNPIEIQKMANWYKCTMERIRLFFFLSTGGRTVYPRRKHNNKKCFLLCENVFCCSEKLSVSSQASTIIHTRALSFYFFFKYRFWHTRREKVTFEETDGFYSIGNQSESNEEWHLLLLQVSLGEMCVCSWLLIGHP